MSKDRIKLVYYNKMVNIDSLNICYSNIQGLYSKGNGQGLQVNFKDDKREIEILKICGEISELIYKLDERLNKEVRQCEKK